MTNTIITNTVRGWLESVQADPSAYKRKDPDRILREALEAALMNYSRRKGDCFSVEVGEFLDDDGDYYAVAEKPRSTKHRHEITPYDAVLRLAGGGVRRVTKNSYEWTALRMALYPEDRHAEDEDDIETKRD